MEVSHFSNADDIQREMDAKVREIAREAFEAEPVAAARKETEQAESRRDSLKVSNQELATRAKGMWEEYRRSALRVDDALIAGVAVTAQQLDNFVRLEAEHKAVLRAASRVVEHLLPEAEILALEATAQEYFTQARQLRQVADERMKVTARLLADAAEHEGEIAFDPRNTISGALTVHADELDRRGRDHLQWAVQRREKWEQIKEQI
jgi:hypothetical protein